MPAEEVEECLATAVSLHFAMIVSRNWLGEKISAGLLRKEKKTIIALKITVYKYATQGHNIKD